MPVWTHHSNGCVLARTQGKGITDILMGPAKLRDTIPGISGTRNLSDNLSDLRAQVCTHRQRPVLGISGWRPCPHVGGVCRWLQIRKALGWSGTS